MLLGEDSEGACISLACIPEQISEWDSFVCFHAISGLIYWPEYFSSSFKVTIANGPDDRLNIDDCSFGIKGIALFLSL